MRCFFETRQSEIFVRKQKRKYNILTTPTFFQLSSIEKGFNNREGIRNICICRPRYTPENPALSLLFCTFQKTNGTHNN